MKRLSFKPLAAFSILMVGLPALAQTTAPKKTPLELLDEGKDEVKSVIDGSAFAGLGFSSSITGKIYQLSNSKLPKVCASHLELVLTTEPVAGGAGKAAANLEELKALATKLKPQLVFKGVPAVSTLAQCIAQGTDAKSELADLSSDPKFSKELSLKDKEAAIDTLGTKNDFYASEEKRLQARIKLLEVANCSDCPKQEKLDALNALAAMDSSSSGPIADIVNKANNDIKDVAAKIQETLDKTYDDFVAQADAAKSFEELTQVRDAIFAAIPDVLNWKISAEDQAKLRKKLYILATQGLSAKAKVIAVEGQSGSGNLFESTVASSDMFAKYGSLAEVKSTSTQSTAAQRAVNFMSETLGKGCKISGVDAALQKRDCDVAVQLSEKNKGSIARMDMISDIDAHDPEIGNLLKSKTAAMDANLVQVGLSCGVQQMMQAPGASPEQLRAAFLKIGPDYRNQLVDYSRCGAAKAGYKTTTAFLTTYGQKYVAADRQNQVLWQSYGLSSTAINPITPAGPLASSNPFALNSSITPDAVAWNAQSGMNYQNSTFDPSLMFRPQADWNRMGTDPKSTAVLPVAIPLNGMGMPSQQIQTRQFQS